LYSSNKSDGFLITLGKFNGPANTKNLQLFDKSLKLPYNYLINPGLNSNCSDGLARTQFHRRPTTNVLLTSTAKPNFLQTWKDSIRFDYRIAARAKLCDTLVYVYRG